MRNYVKMVFVLFILSAISAIILTAFHVQTKEIIDQNRQQERVLHLLKSMNILPTNVQQEVANDSILKDMPEVTEKEKFDKAAKKIERMQYFLKQHTPKELAETFGEKVMVMEIIPSRKNEIIIRTGKEFLELPSQAIDYLHNIYIFKTQNQNGNVYCFEIAGSGFWDKVSGYLALCQGFNKIAGISFFNHKETPGLGQRIEEGWFQAQFVFWNKAIFSETGKLALHVTKRNGLYDGDAGQKNINEIDAITGASETSRAIDRFIPENLHNLLMLLHSIYATNNLKLQDFFDTETIELLKKYTPKN